MAFGGMIRTTKGRNLLAQAEMSKQLNITHVAIGDGFYTGSYNSITALSHQLFTVPVKKTVRENSDELVVEVDISESGLTESYYLRELGIFAQDDQSAVLYAYDNAGTDAELIPAAGGAVSVANRMRFILKISDAINVTVNTADAIYVTPEELSEKLQTYTTYPISYQGNPVIIPNTKAGDYLLPSIKGYTKITKPNTNAEISPTNIATLQNVVNPVFTASDGKGNSSIATLQAELYSLSNGVCDDYDGVSGKLTKQTHKLVFNGTENWTYTVYSGQKMVKCVLPITPVVDVDGNNFTNGYCTHFKWSALDDILVANDYGIYIAPYNTGETVYAVYIFIKESAASLETWKAYLTSQAAAGKPVTVLYQLATPLITYPSIKLTAYDSTTTVSCNDTVLQDMSVTVADKRKVYGAINADMLGGKSPSEYLILDERIGLKNVDLNNIKTVGCYAVKSNNDISTIKNSPFSEAFSLDVSYTLGNNDVGAFSHFTQRAIQWWDGRTRMRISNPYNNGTVEWGEWREYAMGETLTSDKTIYVRKTGNDETGDGSNEKPFLTVGKAIEYANKAHGNVLLFIAIGGGIYEEYNMPDLYACNLRSVTVLGEGEENPANVTIRIHNNNGRFRIWGCDAYIRYLTFESTLSSYNGCIFIDGARVYINNCRFIEGGNGNTDTSGVRAERLSNVVVENCSFSNTAFATVSFVGSYIYANANTGNCRTVSFITGGGITSANGTTPSAPTQHAEWAGGIYNYSGGA